MTDSYALTPPRTDRYDRAWELIDSHDGDVDQVLSIECINKHASVTYKHAKKSTVNKYLGELYKFDSILKKLGYNPIPWTIDETIIQELLFTVWKDKAVSTKKWYTHILDRYLEFYGNRVISGLQLQWPQDMRPNVQWLTDQEYTDLQNVEKTPLEEIVIELELGMGLRCVEVCRLRVRDIHRDGPTPSIQVRGKGRGEGKWRTIPFGIGFADALDRWMIERNKIIDRMQRFYPWWEPPEELIIWSHYLSKPDAGPYSEQGNSLNRGPIEHLREKLGFKFTQHTLRRTFGRRMYHAGVDIETISKLMGHEDTKTTYRYLGINMDDMIGAMARLKEFDERRS